MSSSASQWQLVGEGNAHAALSSDTDRCVVVVRKRSHHGAGEEGDGTQLWDARLRWSAAVQVLLGVDYLLPQVSVMLSLDIRLQMLATLAQHGRQPPPLAIHDLALLMPNCTALPPCGALQAGFDHLVVEIKPKWGCLPTSPAIPPQHAIKKQVSRYQLLQRLKLAQGKVAAISSYDPLDFFSASPQRLQKSLHALLQCPQNNLRLHLNGRHVRPEDHSTVLQSWAGGSTEAAAQKLVELLSHLLLAVDVRQRLVAMQRLDRFDIAGVYPVWKAFEQHESIQNHPTPVQQHTRLGSDGKEPQVPSHDLPELAAEAHPGRKKAVQPGIVLSGTREESGGPRLPVVRSAADFFQLCQKGNTKQVIDADLHQAESVLHDMHKLLDEIQASMASLDHEAATAFLSHLPHGHCQIVLQAYLLAAAAKDCSIMISLQACPENYVNDDGVRRAMGESGGLSIAEWSSQPGQLLTQDRSGQKYLAKVSVIDLDMKPVGKIEEHWRTDKQIMKLTT